MNGIELIKKHFLCLFHCHRTNFASVLTIVAFSLERYLAICHPLHAYKMAGVGRALRILAAIWFLAFLSALPVCVFMTVAHLPYPEEAGPHLVNQTILDSAFCTIQPPDSVPLFELATFIFFILPMILLSVLYIRIGIRIRRTSLGRGRNGMALSGTVNHQNGSKRSASRKNALRMLGTNIEYGSTHFARFIYSFGLFYTVRLVDRS